MGFSEVKELSAQGILQVLGDRAKFRTSNHEPIDSPEISVSFGDALLYAAWLGYVT